MTPNTPDNRIDVYKYYEMIAEPENKATTSLPRFILKRIHNEIYRSELSSLSLFEAFETVCWGQLYYPYSIYFETFNEKIGEMNSNGLNAYWREIKGIKKVHEEIGPQVLTMDHLGLGFVFCIVPLFIALFVFIGELAYFWGKKYRQKLMETLVARYAVRAYVNNNLLSTI